MMYRQHIGASALKVPRLRLTERVFGKQPGALADRIQMRKQNLEQGSISRSAVHRHEVTRTMSCFHYFLPRLLVQLQPSRDSRI